MHGYKWPINCTRTRTATAAAHAAGPLPTNRQALHQHAVDFLTIDGVRASTDNLAKALFLQDKYGLANGELEGAFAEARTGL